MPDNVVDTLRVKIESDARATSDNIDQLIGDLGRLKEAIEPLSKMKGGSIGALSSFARALKTFESSKMDEFFDALDRADPKRIAEIGEAAKGLGGFRALTKIDSTASGNLLAFLNSLQNFGDPWRIKALGDAAASLKNFNAISKIDKNAATNLFTLLNALQNGGDPWRIQALGNAAATLKNFNAISKIDKSAATSLLTLFNSLQDVANPERIRTIGDAAASLKNFNAISKIDKAAATNLITLLNSLQGFADPTRIRQIGEAAASLKNLNFLGKFGSSTAENIHKVFSVLQSVDVSKLRELSTIDFSNLKKLSSILGRINVEEKNVSVSTDKATNAIHRQTKAAHSHHKAFNLAHTALGKFFNSIKRIAFYRMIRGAIKAVTQGFSEGIENMYFWSQAVGTSFAPAMDRLATATLYLKNGFASMWSPLIERAIPIIDHVIDKLVDFFNFAQEGFARLTGAATWTKALKYPVQFAENTEGATKAAKALQNVLMGFDELNVINTPKDSGRGAAGDEKDYSAMFKVMETTGLNDGKNWGQRLADLINNFINGVDWHAKGVELSQKVNNFLKPLNDFLTDTNWQGIGDAIGDFIDGAIEGIDATLIGETLLNTFKAAVGVLIGLISSFAENETGKDLGQKITDFIETVCIGLAEWIQSTDFVQILTNITKIVGDIIEGLDIGRILEAVGVLAENLAAQIPGIVMHSITESALLPLTASLRAVGLGEAADWIDENITGSVDKVTEAFKQAADVATQAGKDAKESAKRQKELRSALIDEKKELIGTLQDLQYSKDLIPTEEFDRRFGLIKDILKGTKVDIQSLPPELRSLATQAQTSFEVLGDGSASFAEGFVDDWDSVDTALANAEGAYGAAYWSIDGYIKAFVKSAAKGAKELGESWKNSSTTIESVVAKFGNTLDAWKLYDQAYRKGLELTKGLKDSMRYFSLNIPATISVTNTTSTAKVHGATFDMSLMGFASGGFTPKAELFYAGENGIPEIMGKVNGRSAVVGGDEITGIADAIYAQGEREEQLLSTLIAVVQAKDFSFTPNAASGRLINQALRQYSGVTG